MNHKIVIVPFDQGGYAKLLFTQTENGWTCSMSDDLMQDLQDCLEGRELRERVKTYVDLNGFDNS